MYRNLDEEYLSVKGVFKVKKIVPEGVILTVDHFLDGDNLEIPTSTFFFRRRNYLCKVNDFLLLTITSYDTIKETYYVELSETDGVILELCDKCRSFYYRKDNKTLRCNLCHDQKPFLVNEHSMHYGCY